MPSDPVIRVFVGENDVSYTEATAVSRNGYRVNAWLPKGTVKFLRISIAPTHPDHIGGSTFTFGLTDFTAAAVDFHLYSEVKFRPVTFEPVTENVRFRAVNPDLEYFLQLGTGNVMKVEPDQVIAVPGVSKVSIDSHINVQWELCPLGEEDAIQLPLDLYPSTLAILDVEDTKAVRVVSNMNPGTVDESVLLNAVLTYNRKLHRYPKIDAIYIDESGRRYRIVYVHGPATVDARLAVQAVDSEQGCHTRVCGCVAGERVSDGANCLYYTGALEQLCQGVRMSA